MPVSNEETITEGESERIVRQADTDEYLIYVEKGLQVRLQGEENITDRGGLITRPPETIRYAGDDQRELWARAVGTDCTVRWTNIGQPEGEVVGERLRFIERRRSRGRDPARATNSPVTLTGGNPSVDVTNSLGSVAYIPKISATYNAGNVPADANAVAIEVTVRDTNAGSDRTKFRLTPPVFHEFREPLVIPDGWEIQYDLEDNDANAVEVTVDTTLVTIIEDDATDFYVTNPVQF